MKRAVVWRLHGIRKLTLCREMGVNLLSRRLHLKNSVVMDAPPTHVPRKTGYLREEKKGGKKSKEVFAVCLGEELQFFSNLTSQEPLERVSLKNCEVERAEKSHVSFVLTNRTSRKSRSFTCSDESDLLEWVDVLAIRLLWIGPELVVANEEMSGFLFVDGKEYWCILANHRFRFFESEDDVKPVKSYLLSNLEVFPYFEKVVRRGVSISEAREKEKVNWSPEYGFVLHHIISDVRRTVVASCAVDLEEWITAFSSWSDDNPNIKSKLDIITQETKLESEKMNQMQGYLELESVRESTLSKQEFWFVLKDGFLAVYEGFLASSPCGAFKLSEYVVTLIQALAGSDETEAIIEKTALASGIDDGDDSEQEVEDDDDVRAAAGVQKSRVSLSASARSRTGGNGDESKMHISLLRRSDAHEWRVYPTGSMGEFKRWARCFELQRRARVLRKGVADELVKLEPPKIVEQKSQTGTAAEGDDGNRQGESEKIQTKTDASKDVDLTVKSEGGGEGEKKEPQTRTVADILSIMKGSGEDDSMLSSNGGKWESEKESGDRLGPSIEAILEEVKGMMDENLEVVEAPKTSSPRRVHRGTLRKKKDRDEEKGFTGIGGGGGEVAPTSLESNSGGNRPVVGFADDIGIGLGSGSSASSANRRRATESSPGRSGSMTGKGGRRLTDESSGSLGNVVPSIRGARAVQRPPPPSSFNAPKLGKNMKEYECMIADGCLSWSHALGSKVIGSAVIATHWLLLPPSIIRSPQEEESEEVAAAADAGREKEREVKRYVFGLEHHFTQKQTYFFAPDEQELIGWITALKREGARVFAKDGTFYELFEGHSACIRCCLILDNMLYSGSNDRLIKQWNINSGECLDSFVGHEGAIADIASGEGGDGSIVLYSASLDHSLRVWDILTGVCLRVISLDADVMCCCVDSNNRVITGTWSQELTAWNGDTGEKALRFVQVGREPGRVSFAEENGADDSGPDGAGHKGSIDCCTTMGNILVTGSWDTTLLSWDLTTGDRLTRFEGHTASVSCCAIASGILYSSSWDQTLRSWNLKVGSLIHEFLGHTGWIRCCCVWDGFILFSGSDDATIRAWNVVTGRQMHVFEGHTKSVQGLCIIPDKGLLFSCSRDKTILAWDVNFLKERM